MDTAKITKFLSEPCLSQTVFYYTLTRKKPTKKEFDDLLHQHKELAVQHSLISHDCSTEAAWKEFCSCPLVKQYLK